jgi:hypothetical protein
LQTKIDTFGWEAGLTNKEKDCYQGFLLELKENDYVVYINTPEWGRCTLARVTGPYFWRFEDRERTDFNHRFHVDSASVMVFDRNAAFAHPSLSARLKLRGRYWRIYLHDEFADLVVALKSGVVSHPRTLPDNLSFLAKAIQPLLINITEQIHHAFPNTNLEGLLAEVLKIVPGVRGSELKWQGGAGDHGADLIVIFESGLPVLGLQRQTTCVVQVKSFEGPQWDTKAVDDIRRALDHYPEAEMGLIVSTATLST